MFNSILAISLGASAGAAALHLFGSLAMTFLGIASFSLVRQS